MFVFNNLAYNYHTSFSNFDALKHFDPVYYIFVCPYFHESYDILQGRNFHGPTCELCRHLASY